MLGETETDLQSGGRRPGLGLGVPAEGWDWAGTGTGKAQDWQGSGLRLVCPAKDLGHERLRVARKRGAYRTEVLCAMEKFAQRIKQYPAKEQAEMRVRVMLPGNMFPGLSPSEQREKYLAEANGYELQHTFPKQVGVRTKAETCEGIRFLCVDDVMDDPEHQGFIIPTHMWNRHRFDTYKDDPEAEKPYIRTVAQTPVAAKPSDNEAPERPPIYSEYKFVSKADHIVKAKSGAPPKTVTAEFWM